MNDFSKLSDIICLCPICGLGCWTDKYEEHQKEIMPYGLSTHMKNKHRFEWSLLNEE